MADGVSRRDLRVDLFRGVALWWIFTDHIPANWIAQFSLRNFALCDATEIFVLLAGYAGGLAYGRSMNAQGWVYAAAYVLRRAGVLYVAHIFLFVVFTAQVSYSATALDRSDFLDEIHLDVLAEAPYRAMLEALKLSFQPAYLNILPMYVMILGAFAFLLPLLRRPLVLLGVSGTAYLAVRFTGVNLPSWTGGGWYFNPIAWQFLFMIGAALSYRGAKLPVPDRVLDVAAVLIVVIGIVLVWIVWPYPEIENYVPAAAARIVLQVDKEGLHPMRLLSILAWVWLMGRLIRRDAAWLQSRLARPFVLAGQHSLPVFCAGIGLSFMGRLVMEEYSGAWVQPVVNLAGAVAMVAVAWMAAWYRRGARTPRPALPPRSQADIASVT